MWEPIAKIVERELQPLADELRVGDSLGQIAEDGVHGCGGAQSASAVCSKQASGAIKRHMMTNCSQHIEDFAILLCCRTHTVGSHDGHLQAGCHRQQRLIARFFIA